MALAPRSLRLRLTLWYGGLFLLGGFLLLAVNFLLFRENFPDDAGDVGGSVAQRFGVEPNEFRPGRPIPNIRPRGRPAEITFAELFGGVLQEVEDDSLRQLLVQSTAALAAMGVVSMGLGWIVAGRMLRPITDISDTVRRISEERLQERVGLRGPDNELKELADQFDVMLDRLETAFEAQREFVANASHELRTPLTIIRTELDVTLGGDQPTPAELARARSVVTRAITRTEHLIDSLLTLARADSDRYQAVPVRLDETVQRAIDERRSRIEEHGLRVETSLQNAALSGDPSLLERLVGNLLDNAIQHNISDEDGGQTAGWISVSLTHDEREATLRVANSGAKIPVEAADRLFERFARLDRSRSRDTGGYGLGLAIARAIARGHGGSASARALPDGGLEVSARLPLGR